MEPRGHSLRYLHVLRRNPPKHTLLCTRLQRVILFAFIVRRHRLWPTASTTIGHACTPKLVTARRRGLLRRRIKNADLEGSAFLNPFVDPSAGIIQIRFSGSATVWVTLSAGLIPAPRDVSQSLINPSIGQPPREVNNQRQIKMEIAAKWGKRGSSSL
jgi:hypothetical protein